MLGLRNFLKCALVVLCAGSASCERTEFKIKGSSMHPTIAPGALVEVQNGYFGFSEPRRWDVVFFKAPSPNQGSWIFRIVGLPGETVSFDESGLLINGTKARLPSSLSSVRYKLPSVHQNQLIQFPYVVPQNSYFVLGDNPDGAFDSRMWGGVSRSAITGKVISVQNHPALDNEH